MDQGRSEEAMTLFNRALEYDPDHEVRVSLLFG